MGTLAHLLVFFFAAQSFSIDIPPIPTWPAGSCTDKSLSTPGWIISDYEVSNGATTFRVETLAAETGHIADMVCTPDNKCQSSGNDTLRGTISTGPDGHPIIGLNETWECEDTGKRIKFAASGLAAIKQCSGADCISSITYLVPGTLSLPVPLTPTTLPPAGSDKPKCGVVGKGQWTISSVSFRNYTKGQCNSWITPDQICFDGNIYRAPFISKGVYLKLNVTNNAIDHELTCNFDSSHGYYELPAPLRCTGGKFKEITLDVALTGTAPNLDLKVEELWYCLEKHEGIVNPAVVIASGIGPLGLTCETYTGITGTTDDIVTNCTAQSGSLVIDGTPIAKKLLPQTSLLTALAVHGGCTYDSIVNPTFIYRTMLVDTRVPANKPNNYSVQGLSAILAGPGFNYSLSWDSSSHKALSESGIDTVYPCTSYEDHLPTEQHWACTFQWNPQTLTITQVKGWECRDKNPATPLFFEGSGSFDWSIQGRYCFNDDRAVCYYGWNTVPSYKVPKVTVSLVNNQPPLGNA
ncbi:hypothetical protein BCR34DRAFT_88121 [Clohesyomyces aquaticus]|uniref:Uncharacterized protein n=1 Tax=Clohesyomyces aquaticus TaxID=1231657 RepID=A0A1Y1YW30_9PLEO|nr:hypothetical protein BCR34DRAFT_88121 [Clohesyomyces aquaticus]